MNTLRDTDEGRARLSVWPVYVAAAVIGAITLLWLDIMMPFGTVEYADGTTIGYADFDGTERCIYWLMMFSPLPSVVWIGMGLYGWFKKPGSSAVRLGWLIGFTAIGITLSGLLVVAAMFVWGAGAMEALGQD